MATQCLECGNKFTLREALCDDWKDSNKSYGCPKCGTFYVKDMNPKKKDSVKAAVIAGGILVPACSLVWKSISNGDTLFTLYGVIIFLSCIVLMYIDSEKSFKPLIKSAHKRTMGHN